jgi:hypothetical protein
MTMIEPTLDDLLDDEIMTPVMRSAGVDAALLRQRLGETARRLGEQAVPLPPPSPRAVRREAVCCWG